MMNGSALSEGGRHLYGIRFYIWNYSFSIFISFLAVIILVFSLSSIKAQEKAPAVKDYIAMGDSLFDKFDTDGSIEQYENALKLESSNYEAMWKLARGYVDKGEVSEVKEDEKSYYLKAEELARRCVSLYPNSAEGHFYLSVAVGRVALFEGGKKKIELSKEVKQEALKAIELDPDHDGAYHVLARWNREIANLNWFLKAVAKVVYGGVPKGATNENAIKYFKKAIQIKPEHINHHLELGRTYLMMGEKKMAEKEFQEALKLPVADKDDPDHKREARELLKEL